MGKQVFMVEDLDRLVGIEYLDRVRDQKLVCLCSRMGVTITKSGNGSCEIDVLGKSLNGKVVSSIDLIED